MTYIAVVAFGVSFAITSSWRVRVRNRRKFKQSRKFKMKIYPAIFFLLLFLLNCAHAQLPRDCSDASQKLLEAEVQQGNPKAQYLLGTQLLTGQCGRKDSDEGVKLETKSAESGYPPAIHILGVILRKERSIQEAVPFFLGAAQKGFRLAEVDLAFAYGEGSPIKNLPLSYAWFSVAESHEEKAELKQFLASNLKMLAGKMGDADMEKANQLKEKLLADFGSIPRFKDDP